MRILILGANGRIARIATNLLRRRADTELHLFLRKAVRLEKLASSRVSVIGGDVFDAELLEDAMRGCDVVYANLHGPLDKHAPCIVRAMTKCGVQRLIFMSSMDAASCPLLHGERHCTAGIEASSLDYTIVRPRLRGMSAAFDGAPRAAAAVAASRQAVAKLVVQLITTPGLHVRSTLDVHQEPPAPLPARTERSARRVPHAGWGPPFSHQGLAGVQP